MWITMSLVFVLHTANGLSSSATLTSSSSSGTSSPESEVAAGLDSAESSLEEPQTLATRRGESGRVIKGDE